MCWILATLFGPLVRRVEAGKSMIWMPGQLLYPGSGVDAMQVSAEVHMGVVANMAKDYAILSKAIQFDLSKPTGAPAPLGGGVRTKSLCDRVAGLHRESRTYSASTFCMPKNPCYDDVCQRMYRTKATSKEV